MILSNKLVYYRETQTIYNEPKIFFAFSTYFFDYRLAHTSSADHKKSSLSPGASSHPGTWNYIIFLQDTGRVYGHPAHWTTFFLKVKSWEWKQDWYYIPSSYSIPKAPQGSQCATLLDYYESLKKTLTSYIPAHSLKLTHLQWGPWLTLLVLHPKQRGVNSIKSGGMVQGQPQGSEAPL